MPHKNLHIIGDPINFVQIKTENTAKIVHRKSDLIGNDLIARILLLLF